jgi:chemotaxis protein methyltransferase CheR
MGTLAVSGTGAAGGAGGYARLMRVVHDRTGLDLEPYKNRFVEHRVAIRVRATRKSGLDGYLRLLARDRGEEMERLLRCLTIHVSSFFRNSSTFDAIRDEVFPALFAPQATRRVRFWSVGCSRGEEPYSLAILVQEHLGRGRGGWDVQIQGMDVDTRVLEEAKAGVYVWAQVADLDTARRERWFARDGARWIVAPEIRRMVRFHRGDILMAPPRGEFDAILCRNLLIYMDRPAQEAVLEGFARCLRPGGFLVLGRTEIFIGAGRDVFEAVDARERIYRRVGGGAAAPATAGAHKGRT